MTPNFSDFLRKLEGHGRTIWLGQSVDTSTIHTEYSEYRDVPVFTTVGCVIRRPAANGAKFDSNLRARLGARHRLMVDSGGFVLMTTQTRAWHVGKVCKLYERIDADHLVSLDFPPVQTDGRLSRRKKYRRTLTSLERLLESFGTRVVPVIHGVDPDEVEQSCAATARLTANPPVIGIGGLVPTLQSCGISRCKESNGKHRSVAARIRCVRDYFPKSRIHVFGAGSLHTVLALIACGAHSVDSIGWRQAAGFGSVYIPGRHRRLLTKREREKPCRPFVDRKDRELLAQCMCPECLRFAPEHRNLQRLASHFKPRAAHNLWVLYAEVAAYLEACDIGQGEQFLGTRLSEAWIDAISLKCA
jgi:queuine/archaeosine tRNA-ribosyltransferase